MKEGLTINDLAKEVMRINNAKRDFVAPTERLSVDSNGSGIVMSVPVDKGWQDVFGVNRVAHAQLSEKLGIPKKYYDRMLADAPGLLAENINTWFRDEPKRRLVRTLDGSVRAFLGESYGILYDNALALTSALPVLRQYPEMEYKSMMLTERRMYIQAVLPALQGEVKVGQPVQAGVVISNSEVGYGRFTVERLLYILSCLNGMIRGESLSKVHVSRAIGDDVQEFYAADTVKADFEAFKLRVRDTVRDAFDGLGFETDLRRLRDTTERKIEAGKIEETVREVSSRCSLIEAEKDEVLHRLIEGGDLSQWGLSMAVTGLANDTDDYDRVVELERIGGQIVDLPETEWKRVS